MPLSRDQSGGAAATAERIESRADQGLKERKNGSTAQRLNRST